MYSRPPAFPLFHFSIWPPFPAPLLLMLRFVGQGERHPVAWFVLLLSRGHSVATANETSADWEKRAMPSTF